nr:radical SAM protein [Desulfobacula sp.]
MGAVSIKKASIMDPKQTDELVVTNWGPRLTEIGKPFNVQPSGKSAIWIEIAGLHNSPDIKVLFGGRPMEDICIHDLGVNASIPTSYLTDIGTKNIVIEGHHSGNHIFVGQFSIVLKVKLTSKSVSLPLVDLITSYYTAHNFLLDIKRFPNTITQDQLTLFEQGVDNLKRLLSNLIPGLNCLLLSCREIEHLIENMASDPAASGEWDQLCEQVVQLKSSTVRITRSLCPHILGHKQIENVFQIPADSQETALEYKSKSYNSFKRHNLELMYLESLAGITKPLSTPGHLLLGVSNRCNYRCRSCYQSFRQNFAYNDLPREAIKNLQPFLPSCTSANIAGAGEPLLSPDTPLLIQMLAAYGVLTDLVTNGSLLGRLKGIAHNIEHICISMDGASSETVDKIRFGARFNRIIADIKRLPIDIRYKITFNMVVCRANVHEVHKLVRLAKKIGIAGVGLQEFCSILPWHDAMKLSTEDQPLLMQQIRASRKEVKRQGVTSFIVECATYDEKNQKVIKPDYKQILKMLDKVQTPVESAEPMSWMALALEFQDATQLKIPKVLLETLETLCDNLRYEDAIKADAQSQDAEICSRMDSLLVRLNAQPLIKFPHCLAPYTLMNIHSDGTVKPCCILDRRCGSLTTDSAHRVWHSPAYIRLRKSFATGMDLPEECIGCKDGVRFAQSVKLLTNARDKGIDVSKIVMPADGCVPGEITELLINSEFPSTKAWHLPDPTNYDSKAGIISANVDSPVTQHVAVTGGHHYFYSVVARFANKEGVQRNHSIDQKTEIGLSFFESTIIRIQGFLNRKVVLFHKLFSPIAIFSHKFFKGNWLGRIYFNRLNKHALGRMQIKWIDKSGKVIATNIKVFNCQPTWNKETMEVIAPIDASSAIGYVRGHTLIPLEFKSCSLRKRIL